MRGEEELVVLVPAAIQARFTAFLFVSQVVRQLPAMVGEIMFGSAVVQQGWREWGDLHKLDTPAQRWRLCHAFDGVDGASQLHRWSRLALVSGRTR